MASSWTARVAEAQQKKFSKMSAVRAKRLLVVAVMVGCRCARGGVRASVDKFGLIGVVDLFAFCFFSDFGMSLSLSFVLQRRQTICFDENDSN